MATRTGVTAEQKAALVLALVTGAYCVRSAPGLAEGRRREIAKGGVQRVPSAERIQDHPLVSWLLPNLSMLFVLKLKERLVGKSLSLADSDLKNFFKLWAGGVIGVESVMAINWAVINKVYAHVPFFSDGRKKQTLLEVMTDYLTCNTVVNVVTSALQAYMFRKMRSDPDPSTLAKLAEPFRPLRFLFRLLWVRAFVDVGFWAGHKVMHHRAVYWTHKKHHEHNKTQLTTNYHFAWYDLLVEAFLPFFAGVMAHEKLLGSISETEVNAMGLYVFWFEVSSHAGKPLPTMNIIPPLAPWTQALDDFNSWFHEVHHRVLKTNYSISPWFDVLMGTARWELSSK